MRTKCPAATASQSCYYRARYYDPQVGRFLTEDPNVLEFSLSAYSYAENAAATYVDPYGYAKSKPMPILEGGLDPKSSEGQAIAIGFHEALNRLHGGNCASFFGCERDASETLQQMAWGTFSDTERRYVLAHTTTNHMSTQFNTAGDFFSGTGYWGAPSSGQRYFFGSQSDFQAFIMLHELAHHFPAQTKFRPDGPDVADHDAVNEANSLLLINACFRDARRMK